LTYLYLFSEGNTAHTLTLWGRTTPPSATSSSRTAQTLLSPVTFWGAQHCTVRVNPWGSGCLRSAAPLPSRSRARPGRHGIAAGYISNHGWPAIVRLKRKKFRAPGATAPGRQQPCWQCAGEGSSAQGRLQRDVCIRAHRPGSRVQVTSFRSRRSRLAAGSRRVPGELRQLGQAPATQARTARRGEASSPLQSTERIKPLLVAEQGGLLKKG